MRDAPNGSVLVIDDDAAVRRACVELLAARGLLTYDAPNVRDGLKLFSERRPTAVVLDMKLPDGLRSLPATPVYARAPDARAKAAA